MKTAIAFALAAGKLAAAHTTFQSFVIDGTDKGQHTGVQVPSNGNNPILDVTSDSMKCNGGSEADDYIEVAAGSEIQLQWHHNDGASTSGDADEPIASSHKGPVMVYISPADAKGEGEVWVKLQEDGLASDGSTWGVDTFITNKGLVTVKIPELAAGNYWIRPEIIALHEASTQGKAQFYNGCGQIKVTGSGSLSLPSGVDMTKAYSATDPGVLCNIYSGSVACTSDGSAGYTVPGPDVWDQSSSGSGSGSSSGSSSAAASSAASSAAATSAAASSAAATSAPASSAAATSAAAAASSAASSVVAAPAPTITSGYSTGDNTPSAASSAAQPTATVVDDQSGSGSSSGSTLPEEFTISEFISWLETKTGSAAAKRLARALSARAHPRDFA